MSPQKPVRLPDSVDEQIRFANRLPQFLVDEVAKFVREITAPMCDEEFFALRSFWQESFKLFATHHDDAPEAKSAHEFITTLLWATNHRARGIAPLPDSPYPTVSELKAENEALKARIAELEAMAELPSNGSLLDKIRGKDVWDKDRFPEVPLIDREAFREILDEIIKRKAKAKKEDERRMSDERLADAKARADAKVEDARRILEERENQLKKDREAGRIIHRHPIPPFNTSWEQLARARHDLLIAELEARVAELESQLEAVTIEAGFLAEGIADSDQKPS